MTARAHAFTGADDLAAIAAILAAGLLLIAAGRLLGRAS